MHGVPDKKYLLNSAPNTVTEMHECASQVIETNEGKLRRQAALCELGAPCCGEGFKGMGCCRKGSTCCKGGTCCEGTCNKEGMCLQMKGKSVNT